MSTIVQSGLQQTFAELWDQIRRGNLYSGQPRTAASEEILAIARKAIDLAKSSGESGLLAEALCMMAYALNANEDYPEALTYYKSAIAELERAGDHHRAARIRLGYIAALAMNGHCAEAVKVGQKAHTILLNHDDTAGLARLSVNLGTVYQRLDQHARALEYFSDGAAYFEKEGETAAVAQIYLNSANSLSFLDRFEEAARQYDRTEEIARGLGRTDLWQHAAYNKAYIYVLTGRYAEALGMYADMRKLFAKQESLRHEALCDLDECEIYLHLHLPHDAQILAERAASAFEKLQMGYERAKATACLGTALTQLRQYGEAHVVFSAAQELFEAQGNELWKAVVQLYRAEVLFSVGRLWEAQSLAASAEEAFERLGCPAKEIVSIVLLGRIALDGGRLDQADYYAQRVRDFAEGNPILLFHFACYALCAEIAEKRSDIETAKACYELAAAEFEKQHTHLHHDELGVTFFKGRQEIYEALVEFCLMNQDEDEDRQAFVWCEKAKSQTFVDLLSHHLRTVRSQADLALLDRVHRIRDELNGSYLRFRPEVRAGAAKTNEIDLKEGELIRALTELSKSDAEYASLHQVNVTELSDVQAALPEGTAILEYFISGDEIMAFLIEPDGFTVKRHISPLDRVQHLAGRLRQQTNRLEEESRSMLADNHSRNTMDLVLHELHRQLISPVITGLKVSRLIIVPHGLMHLLPFHAFFDGSCYLGEFIHVSILPSSSVFKSLADRTHVKVSPGRVSKVTAATRADLVGKDVSGDLVRIDGSVMLRQENPLLSCIEFSDGKICTPDIYSLNCAAGVLALMGRQYRSGAVATADDLLGLVRGFLYAGASSVLTRVWNTPESAGGLFLDAFSEAWKQTGNRDEAMRQARESVKRKLDHPYYWAPFSLWGGL